MSFLDDLGEFGPDSTRVVSRDEAWLYCARLAERHYENFSVVTWLTPQELRPAFQSIYAFCRWSDDLGDEVGDRMRATELLGWWRGELESAYQGQANHPVFIALSETIRRYSIPIEPLRALISAFEQDQIVTEYESYEQLLDYCTRSADPVGRLVLYVGEAFNDASARLSDLTCSGLQLANFWQDVARDAAIGRVYLPRVDRDRFGVTAEEIRSGSFSPAFRELMRSEVARARQLLVDGRELLPMLPRKLVLAVDLFNRGGLAILDLIERNGFDVLSARPSLGKKAKAGLIARALWERLRPRMHQANGVPARSSEPLVSGKSCE